ncbi:MAG: hypothetical protein FJ146_12005 [Deltaproteobacteria bacterium]|nr:hypothetical protein [Deltaproteobacteria bacterium]
MGATTPTRQFSSADHETWRRFHEGFFASLPDFEASLHPFYKSGLSVLRDLGGCVPSLGLIQELLAPQGWTACYVDGYIEPWRVAQLIAARVMPISSAVRPADELYFAREPDLIHDLFGHLPSLLNPEYRRLLTVWSRVASMAAITPLDRALFHVNKSKVRMHEGTEAEPLEHLDAALAAFDVAFAASPTPFHLVDKLYFWIFEFGLLKQDDGFAVMGAGLISSLSELRNFTHRRVIEIETAPITIDSVLKPYAIANEQTSYLAARSVNDFYRIINQAMSRMGDLKGRGLCA